MRRSTIMLFVVCMAVLCGSSAWALVPEGWVYHKGDYAYSPDAQGWFYFNALDTQWVVDIQAGVWDSYDNASGWMYFNWPYAYSSASAHWQWFNVNDVQWVCNMSQGIWSLLGYDPAPNGMTTIPHGTNAGTDPDFGIYNLRVEAFYMDKCEVTKALWDEVHDWAVANGYAFDNPGAGKAADHPVQMVNWYDVVKWCNARSEKEGRPPVYTVEDAVYRSGREDSVEQTSAAGYRLPSDVEWEYAARGGAADHRFPWADSDDIQHARANYWSSDAYSYDTSPTREYHPAYSGGDEPHTSPVGSFASNGYGLHDFAGNVCEWCFDFSGSSRIARGGAWIDGASGCRIGRRYIMLPDHAGYDLGFRTVLPPAPAATL